MRNNSPGEAGALLKARGVTYDDFMHDLDDLHSRVKSWRFVGEVLGVSGAYARLIAQGHRVAGTTAVLRWIEYRAASKPARRPRPRVRRPWMGAELSAAMDAAGVSDADVRRLVAAALAGPVPGVEVAL